MRKEHRSGRIIRNLSSEELFDFFKCVLDVLQNGREALDACAALKDDSLECEEDFYDMIEGYAIEPATEAKLKDFTMNCFSEHDYVNHYYLKAFNQVLGYSGWFKRYWNSGIGAKDSKLVESFEECTKDMLSKLAYVLFYEFSMDEFLATCESGDGVVDSIVDRFASQRLMEPEQVVSEVKVICDAYPIHLELFDAVPELEDQYLQLMGPAAIGVDEENLTLELVNRLLSGSITPEELCELCAASVLDSASTEGVDDTSEKMTSFSNN